MLQDFWQALSEFYFDNCVVQENRNRNLTHPKVFDGPDFICDHKKAVFFADDVIIGNQIYFEAVPQNRLWSQGSTTKNGRNWSQSFQMNVFQATFAVLHVVC